MITKAGNKYKAYEYFIKYNEIFLRFAFYMDETDFKENMPMNFETIVKTAEIKGEN